MTISYSNTQADAQNFDLVLPIHQPSSKAQIESQIESHLGTHAQGLSPESTLTELPLHHF